MGKVGNHLECAQPGCVHVQPATGAIASSLDFYPPPPRGGSGARPQSCGHCSVPVLNSCFADTDGWTVAALMEVSALPIEDQVRWQDVMNEVCVEQNKSLPLASIPEYVLPTGFSTNCLS